MATVSKAAGEFAHHGTLVAETVDTITFRGDWKTAEVLNRGTGDIYFNVDDAVSPTVGGANTFVVPSNSGLEVEARKTRSTTVVKVISGGTPAYSVTVQ